MQPKAKINKAKTSKSIQEMKSYILQKSSTKNGLSL